MPLRRLAVLALLQLTIVIAFSIPQRSAAGKSPHVPAFERIFSEFVDEDEMEGEPAHGGRLLMTELNCVACHKGSSTLAARVKTAPHLTGAGQRIRPNHLADYLLDPQKVKPGSTMPQVLSRFSDAERREAATAIAHYLTSLGGPPAQTLPRYGDGEMGEQLFHELGCLACHDSPKPDSPRLATSKPLGDVAAKYTLPSLTSFLLDPHAVRPGGRMPSLQLAPTEARRIAAYLLQLPEIATVKVSYYEGNWKRLPDFSKLKPKSIDGVDEIDIKHAKRKDNFGLRFEGKLTLERSGEYTFHLKSDDGSRLIIDGKTIVDHDGIHGETTKSGKATLESGVHNVIVDVFEAAGGELIRAEIEGPGLKRQPLHESMSASGDKETPAIAPIQFVANEDLIEQGRRWYAKAGCASCHQLKENGKAVGETIEAPSLASLDGNKGCLAEAPGAKAFDYRLRETQRSALRTALAELKQSPPKTLPIGHSLAAFNCYACHSRGGFGGVEIDRNEAFQGTIPEMGDEGRIPPHLDGVGAKLTDKWLTRILSEGSKDRPYMITRMPKFGAASVGHLHGQLIKADRPRLGKPPEVVFDEPISKVKAHGRRLVGDKGLSCIKCHTFGRFRATGIQSIDLKTMSQRLREDWLRLYLRNPQRFRPRTRMPTAWPEEGPSLVDNVLDGDSEKQIAAIWAYLLDGSRARIPSGIEIKTNELIPIDEAIIYRNFIQGAGSRAIGVGYPEGVNQAWDANNLRLALLWQGRFIDASRHWSGRGQGYQPPAGEKVLTMPSGVTIASLPSNDADWPKETAKERGQRFRGYTLTADQRPAFRYEAESAAIVEFLNTEIESGDVLAAREFAINTEGADKTLWVRLAVANEIRKDADGWYIVDGVWKTRVQGDANPLIRDSQGKKELLVPLAPGKQHSFAQQLFW